MVYKLLEASWQLYHWPHGKRGKNVHDYRELNERARAFWFRHASSETFVAMKSGKLKNYMIHDQDGGAIMMTLATRGLCHHYRCRTLPGILAKMRVVKLIMQDAHKVDH